MKFDKTKHWVLDPSYSAGESECAPRQAAHGADAAPRPRETQASSEALPLRNSTRIYQTADLMRRAVTPPPRKQARGTATRIMPIEQLLADANKPKPGDSQVVKPLRPESAKRMLRELSSDSRVKVRRAVALLALAGSALLAYLSPFEGMQASASTRERPQAVMVPKPQNQTPVAPRVPASENAPVATPPASESPVASAPVSVGSARVRADKREQRERSTVPTRDHLQRSAVDAVARGDYDAAVRTYDLLLQRQPDHLVYAEAARILRARRAVRPR